MSKDASVQNKKQKKREKEKTVAHDNDVLTTSFQQAKKQKYKHLCYDTIYRCNVIKLPSAKTNPSVKVAEHSFRAVSSCVKASAAFQRQNK